MLEEKRNEVESINANLKQENVRLQAELVELKKTLKNSQSPSHEKDLSKSSSRITDLRSASPNSQDPSKVLSIASLKEIITKELNSHAQRHILKVSGRLEGKSCCWKHIITPTLEFEGKLANLALIKTKLNEQLSNGRVIVLSAKLEESRKNEESLQVQLQEARNKLQEERLRIKDELEDIITE